MNDSTFDSPCLGNCIPTTDGFFPGRRISSSSLVTTQGDLLPRWSVNKAIYHIAFHLADSIPVAERMKWQGIREELQHVVHVEKRKLTDDERELLKSAYDAHIEKFLASGHGECLLRHAEVANRLAETMEYGHGKDYLLHEWCVMPNHLHVIAAFDEGDIFRRTISAWCRIMAHQVNRLLGRKGPVWMRDAYTHIIRTEAEYAHQLSYVWRNPDTAGLASGYLRRRYVP